MDLGREIWTGKFPSVRMFEENGSHFIYKPPDSTAPHTAVTRELQQLYHGTAVDLSAGGTAVPVSGCLGTAVLKYL
jgi:hypothetical protein